MKPLKSMPYAQAHVEISNDGSKTLVSYKTKVARLDKDGWLTINGLYSVTTRKHIKAFLKEILDFDMDLESIKKLISDKLALNINTGEVIERGF